LKCGIDKCRFLYALEAMGLVEKLQQTFDAVNVEKRYFRQSPVNA
jgi:hypothetical protein